MHGSLFVKIPTLAHLDLLPVHCQTDHKHKKNALGEKIDLRQEAALSANVQVHEVLEPLEGSIN